MGNSIVPHFIPVYRLFFILCPPSILFPSPHPSSPRLRPHQLREINFLKLYPIPLRISPFSSQHLLVFPTPNLDTTLIRSRDTRCPRHNSLQRKINRDIIPIGILSKANIETPQQAREDKEEGSFGDVDAPADTTASSVS